MQTASFNRMYTTNDPSSVHSVGNQVNYTYVSNINSSVHFTIDHFVVSNDLCDYVNKHCTIDDENRSDHLPLCMDISLPVDVDIVQESRQFEPKPKWHATTPVGYDYCL